MVELLMEASPGTLEMVSNNGRSVLHTASLAGHEDMVKRILETSSDMINSQDSCGNTALMDAARAGHLACVRLLASSAGSDLGTEDRWWRSPLRPVPVRFSSSKGRSLVLISTRASVSMRRPGTTQI